jgi:two-component system, chemotaxis family, sensor kinase Cph1
MNSRLLETCELEALHLSGAILPHGTLLVVDRDGKISHVAANIADWLGTPPEAWLDQSLPDELATPLLDLALKSGSRLMLEDVMQAPAHTGKGLLDLVASRNQEQSITLELTASQVEGYSSGFDPGCPPLLTSFSNSPTDKQTITAAQEELVQHIMNITGFQRVMLYSFREEGDGQVIAEARQGEAFGSYLGLRFPASDIPHIARALYLKNPWRLIPEPAKDPVPLLSRVGSAPDLTYSDLRSVSEVHRVYLANMGVTASLSFPVISGGVLIALVACHHNSPRQPPLRSLIRASRLTADFGLAMSASQAHNRIRLIDGLARRFDSARFLLHRHGDLISAWQELGELLMHEFSADGASLCQDDACPD